MKRKNIPEHIEDTYFQLKYINIPDGYIPIYIKNKYDYTVSKKELRVLNNRFHKQNNE